MKTITINVSEPTYKLFKQLGKKRDLGVSELIRQAMDFFINNNSKSDSKSILDSTPYSSGKILREIYADDDLLEEMTKDV